MAPRALYRDSDGWVTVHYGLHLIPIPRDTYIAKGYQPPYDKVPTQEQYNDAQQAAFQADLEREAAKTR
jgi:hypothetical protein